MSRKLTTAGRPPWVIYTIYENPKDFPGKFVVRGFDALTATPHPQPIYVGTSIVDARNSVPPGQVRLERYLEDDAAIKEVWV